MLDLNALPHHAQRLTNRYGLELFVRFNGNPATVAPLAIVAHGFSDVHDAKHMRAVTSALVAQGYHVVTYDATHSWGRSEGNIREATVTGVYEDLEDVVAWAKLQPWWQSTFVLAGHSMGGAAALRFTSTHMHQVSQLILMNPLVSGQLLGKRLPLLIRGLWRLLGRLPDPFERGKVYNYQLLRDGLDYDGRSYAAAITVPTLLVTGGRDKLILPLHQKLLVSAFSQTVIIWRQIPGANHTFAGYDQKLIDYVKAFVPMIEAHA